MDSGDDAKRNLLRKQNVLHPKPQSVTTALFQNSTFFDPRDLIQVKYEMLRSVQNKQTTVQQASREAGLSRPAFYQAQANFQDGGLAGLIPQKSGPRGAHKMTPAVIEFLQQIRSTDPALTFSQLAQQVTKQFAVEIHPRTIERVLLRRQKKR